MLREKAPLKRGIIGPREISEYDEMFLGLVFERGGFYNAHGHLDRAGTLKDVYLKHINTTPLAASLHSLPVKQNLVGDLHNGIAYTEEDLRERMARVIERLISYGTTGLATCIDVSPDIREDGLLAWRIAREIKEIFADRIAIRLGPHPIFGFKDGTGRWDVYQEAAKTSDFLTCLPEKDLYFDESVRDSKVGFRKHIRMVFDLACELGKEVHLHLDQLNDPAEKGTKTLIEGLRWLNQPAISEHSGPAVWAIHMLSPAAYSEKDFAEVVDGLLEHNIGVIVCATAGLSNRQPRPINAPTHNSITRVLELIKCKVPILFGTDNICDFFVPQANGDMLEELKVAGLSIRFPLPDVLAKLAAGEKLNEVDRERVGQALYQEEKTFKELDPAWQSAVDLVKDLEKKRWY